MRLKISAGWRAGSRFRLLHVSAAAASYENATATLRVSTLLCSVLSQISRNRVNA
jgi:hypothetical protein